MLIVDDEPAIRKVLKYKVDWKKYNMKLIGEATNGEEAYNFVMKNSVDIVFTDIKMPKMDGNRLIESAHDICNNTVFVVLSAYSDFPLVKEAFKLGIYDYLLKSDINTPVMYELLTKLKDNFTERYDKKTENVMGINEGIDHMLTNLTPVSDHFANITLINIEIRNNMGHDAVNRIRNKLISVYKEINHFYVNQNHLYLICEYKLKSKRKLRELIVSLSNGLFKFFEESFGIISFGVSSTGTYGDIERLMKETDTACEYSFYENINNRIIYYEEKCRRNDEEIDIIKYKKKIKRLIIDFRMAGIRGCFNSFFEDIKKLCPSRDKCYENVCDLFIYLVNHLYDIDLLPGDFAYNSGEITEGIKKIDNFYGLIEWINEHLKSIEDYFNIIYSSDIIKMIELYINTNIDSRLTLGEIGTRFELSENYISQQFSKKKGITYIKYVNGKKIEKAKHLLLNTGLKVKEISELLGYRNVEHFSRIFKDETGKSPALYRQCGCNEKPLNKEAEVIKILE